MEISVRSTSRGWCKPSEGRKHGGNVSMRQFRTWLKNGLRHVQLQNGRIFTKYEWIDAYLEQFEVENEAKRTAREMVEGF